MVQFALVPSIPSSVHLEYCLHSIILKFLHMQIQSNLICFGWLSKGENLPDKIGDYLIVEKYWSHWMDTSESLLWLDTDVRWGLKVAHAGKEWDISSDPYQFNADGLLRSKHVFFLSKSVSDKIWTSGKITVPDSVMSLRAVALVMSENLGLGFTPVPQKVKKPCLYKTGVSRVLCH